MDMFLIQLFVFFTASAIAVPIAKKLGLGSVLGYLIAGIVIGPFGLSLISDVESVMHITEFGVVMMLFLVGLELKPSMLWRMKVPILGTGGLQVLLSTLVIGLCALSILPWQQALAVGLTLALSSTAIVVQTLKEKGLMNSQSGRSIFSVLLFQDLAVIPMLALIPLLGSGSHSGGHESGLVNISHLPSGLQFIIVLLSIFAVFFIGKYVSRPIFRIIAQTHVREIFVAAALAMVVGTSLLMTIVGLSPALGTFIAGVVLADSEYRHELESDIEPFKGLLLGVFFISIGASLNFILIQEKLLMIAIITVGLMVLKFIVLLIVSMIYKFEKKDRLFFALALAQGGEFAFVLFRFISSSHVMSVESTEPFVSAVAISMFLTPIVFKIYEKINKQNNEDDDSRAVDEIDEKGHKVILAGFGQLGTDIGRFLLSSGVKPVILDHDATNVDILRKFGFEVYYGDVSRLDLLEAAGASEAELIIITVNDIDLSSKLVHLVKKHYPNLKIVMSSSDMESTYQLMDLGVDQIKRKSFGSALMMGQDALKILGYDPYDAHRLMRIFRKHDEDMMGELYKQHQEDLGSYISEYQQQMKNLEELMILDLGLESELLDEAWTGVNPNL